MGNGFYLAINKGDKLNMNRKLLAIALSILSSTMSITACDTSENSDEAISIKKLESAMNEKLREDIDKENDIDTLDLDNDGEMEYVVRVKTKENHHPLSIIIVNNQDGNLVIKDEIKSVGEDFEEIKYMDINNNGRLEIIVGVKAGENMSKGISIYEYKNGKATEAFEEYYSDYILEDIDNDGIKEMIIIKEKEKEDKSYAYLYRCQENGFENTKKVEIDPTLDSKADILSKLL